MKRTFKLFAAILVTVFVVSLTSCKKDLITIPLKLTTNTESITVDGVQQKIDSMRVVARVHNSKISEVDIFAFNNTDTYQIIGLGLLFNPADSNYKSGTTFDFNSGYAEIECIDINGNEFDNSAVDNANTSGTITITKNDVSARRIEGTLNNCVVPKFQGTSKASIELSGSFAVTY